jgi:hypothetical protein
LANTAEDCVDTDKNTCDNDPKYAAYKPWEGKKCQKIGTGSSWMCAKK